MAKLPSTAATKFSDSQIEKAIKAVPEWAHVGDVIQRTIAFDNFIQAMQFVNKVAQVAEASQHHPDILIRYNKVTLSVNTHDAGGITKKDFELAAKVESMVGRP